MKLRHRLFRWLGIVSPSGAYPLPPRWAIRKARRDYWYPPERVTWAMGDRSVAAGGSIGVAVTGRPCACGQVCICGPVTTGPLTDFRHDPPRHVCAPACQPGDGGPATCFRPSTSGRQEGAQGC